MGKTKKKTHEADAWLEDFLGGGGWIAAKRIYEAAEELTEFSTDQIKAGLRRLGAQFRRTKTVPSTTEWRLGDYGPQGRRASRTHSSQWDSQHENTSGGADQSEYAG